MNVVFIGDVFGKSGRSCLISQLDWIRSKFKPDFIVMNGENLADGKGLTERTAKPLFDAGIDVITGGNHLWDRRDSFEYIKRSPAIVKPMNYPKSTPGSPSYTVTKENKHLTVINLCGQVFMPSCNSPFGSFDTFYDQISVDNRCILLDFHAESTAEKRAMGWYCDGKISAMIGTHTHIQTADEEILPNGTAYITDAGMTGAHDSVIGVKKHLILEKFNTSIPVRYETADHGLQINGVYISIDDETGIALEIQRIKYEVRI